MSNFYLKRNVILEVFDLDGVAVGDELPIVDETLSFSQSTSTQSSARDTIGLPDRSRSIYTDALSPVKFSFPTYLIN